MLLGRGFFRFYTTEASINVVVIKKTASAGGNTKISSEFFAADADFLK